VASLVGLVVVTRVGGGLVQLVIAYSGSILAVTICSAVWLFVKHKPWLLPRWSSIRRSRVAGIASVGGMFFVVQIAGLLIFQSNNLIIAHYLGVSEVTPYSVAFRLFTYTVLLQTLIVPTLWPAFGEALARGDTSWISRTLRLNLTLSPLIAAALAVPLVVLGRQIIRAWAGSEAVPSFTLLVLLGLWSVIYALMTATGTFLNGVGRLKGQMVYGLTTAIASVGLAIWLVPIYGAIGVIIGMIVSYLVCAVIPALVETRLAVKKMTDAVEVNSKP
jgi:O-antigen/teichoic acid export membrane protein